jgi:hypothetical protein
VGQPAGQALPEQVRHHRLGEVVVHAGGQAGLPVLLEGIGRHRDDGQGLGRVPLADQPGGLQAVHHRHLHVHQHQVEAAALDQAHGLLAVVGQGVVQAPAAQQHARHLLVGGVVLGQQDARPAPVGTGRGLGAGGGHRGRGPRAGGRDGHLEGQLDPEQAARALAAVRADVAAHQQGQALADGQAQAGAAEAPGGGDVGLLEGLEQVGHLLLADADAGVLHLEAQAQLPPRAGQHPHPQVHPAVRGELHRVAQQVQQDLLQPQAVAQHPGRAVGARSTPRATSLARARSASMVLTRSMLVLSMNSPTSSESLRASILEKSRMSLMTCSRCWPASPILSSWSAWRGQRIQVQQVGKADDGVHRRADLVAHVGQEGALGLVGGLGVLLGLGQVDLDAPAPHDAPEVAAEQGHLAQIGLVVGLGLVGHAQQHPRPPAVADGHQGQAQQAGVEIALVRGRVGQFEHQGLVGRQHARLGLLAPARQGLAQRRRRAAAPQHPGVSLPCPTAAGRRRRRCG